MEEFKTPGKLDKADVIVDAQLAQSIPVIRYSLTFAASMMFSSVVSPSAPLPQQTPLELLQALLEFLWVGVFL
jgi:hypothetical protein